MKQAILAVLSVFIMTMTHTALAAGGSKNLNPVQSVEVGVDCVYVFVGDDNVCEDAISPDQSQQAYMCEVLKLCPKDTK